jgi:hypothetical protein
VLYPRHIAEADDAEMTNLEAQMTAAAARVRTALDAIAEDAPQDSGPLAEARAALDRFMSIHAQILDLSRRNSNVRALALALGRKTHGGRRSGGRTERAPGGAAVTRVQRDPVASSG